MAQQQQRTIPLEGDSAHQRIEAVREFFERKIADTNDPRVSLFSDLIAFLEAIAGNDHDAADDAIQRIIKDSRGGLYNEVGRVTRKLHDSIKGFKQGIDQRIRDLAVNDMPYAVDKLQFVIAETEAAANKTTDVVEKYFQSLESFGDHLKMVDGPAESIRYFQAFQSELENDLTTILTTQQFQDLTGQTIRKVMAVVADIENELVKLVTTFGDAPLDLIPAAISAPAEAPETVSQSDVDDLLKELGF